MIKNKNIYRKEETLMAQLWGGRFTKETDQLVYNFNAYISFDQKFYKQDIRGSIAHVTMLASVSSFLYIFLFFIIKSNEFTFLFYMK